MFIVFPQIRTLMMESSSFTPTAYSTRALADSSCPLTAPGRRRALPSGLLDAAATICASPLATAGCYCVTSSSARMPPFAARGGGTKLSAVGAPWLSLEVFTNQIALGGGGGARPYNEFVPAASERKANYPSRGSDGVREIDPPFTSLSR